MNEGGPKGVEKKPEPRKISLAERALPTEEYPDRPERFEALTKRARQLEAKLFASFGSAPTERQIEDATSAIQEELIEIARLARDFGNQYRHFYVGAAMLGLRFENDLSINPWVVLFDANTKPLDTDDKWCAEQYLMDRAESSEERVDRILSFTVVGKPQTDNDSQISQATLTPCKMCRDRMLQMTKPKSEEENTPPIINLETEVITAHSGQTAFRKYQRVKNLHEFHKEYVEID